MTGKNSRSDLEKTNRQAGRQASLELKEVPRGRTFLPNDIK